MFPLINAATLSLGPLQVGGLAAGIIATAIALVILRMG